MKRALHWTNEVKNVRSKVTATMFVLTHNEYGLKEKQNDDSHMVLVPRI